MGHVLQMHALFLSQLEINGAEIFVTILALAGNIYIIMEHVLPAVLIPLKVLPETEEENSVISHVKQENTHTIMIHAIALVTQDSGLEMKLKEISHGYFVTGHVIHLILT